MLCPALLLHAEVDVGGMSFYLLLTCPRSNKYEMPNMLKSALRYCKDHLAVPLRSDGIISVRLNRNEKTLEAVCAEKKKGCKGIVKVWCRMNYVLYPFLTDVEIAKNIKNYLVFSDIKGDYVREGGGYLSLRRIMDIKTINLRMLENELSERGIKAVPLLAPPGTFFIVTSDMRILYVSKEKKMEVMKVKEGLKDASPFFFGYSFALLTKDKVTVYKKSGEEWVVVDEVRVPDAYKVEWGSLEGEPALMIYAKDKVIIKSLKGDMAVLNTKGAIEVSVTINTETVALSYPSEVKIINLYTGEEETRLKISGVKKISWSLYSDFAAMCSDTMCWIFSNLTKTLVTAKKITNVKDLAWGSSTYNLYMARGEKMSTIFFNPHGVRTWRLIVRRPIPREI